MPKFIRTVSFTTGRSFQSEEDDPKVNEVLQKLQTAGAEILDIEVKLAGRASGVVAGLLDSVRGPRPDLGTRPRGTRPYSSPSSARA